MTVSVSDIERWSPGDVREVFHAARSRWEASVDAGDGIAALPVFGSWGGDAADAARRANDRLRVDLDAQGNESLAVATAARTAADDMQRVKAELAQLEADVNNSRGAWRIDPASSRVVPGPNPRVPLTVAVSEGGQLQARLTAILAEAARVDDELASAIKMATGAAPLPSSPHDLRPEILDALSRPLPTDPKQFHDLWEQLTREEKDWLYQQNHFIGNQGGMPSADRDVYNRMNLADLMQRIRPNSSGCVRRTPTGLTARINR